MSKVFTSKQFIEKLKWLVNDVPNYYHSENGTWCNYNKSRGKFMMDCVVSIKGLLWGFKADKNRAHGGGIYLSNGVADFGANDGIDYCTDKSQDFHHLVPGEYLCMRGTKYSHAGVYLGNGKVFECTTGWGVNRCIISDINENGDRIYNGVKNLKWIWHGKLQYIDYSDQQAPVDKHKERVKELQRVLNEQYGCGLEVDGIFGKLTENACRKNYLYQGKKAPIHIKWLQRRLVALGYSVGSCGIDGYMGRDTTQAVKNFQRDKHIEVDGYVGKDTSRKLVE
jgi:hypothetical protein